MERVNGLFVFLKELKRTSGFWFLCRATNITQQTFRTFKDGGHTRATDFRLVFDQTMSSKENAYRRISGFGKLLAECQTKVSFSLR